MTAIAVDEKPEPQPDTKPPESSIGGQGGKSHQGPGEAG